AQRTALKTAIRRHGEGAIYVAVLPAAALEEGGGTAAGALRVLVRDVHRWGVFVVVVGGRIRVGAKGRPELARSEAAALMAQAVKANRARGLAATLDDFVGRVGGARFDADMKAISERKDLDDHGGGGHFAWYRLVILAGSLVFGAVLIRRRRRVHRVRE